MSLPDHSFEPPFDEAFAFYWSQTAPDTSRLILSGELDMVTADHARAAFQQAQRQTRDVICDLGDVIFVDLAGLRVLLDATSHAQARRGRLTIVNYPSIVTRMLTLLGLEDCLDIEKAPARAPQPSRETSSVGHADSEG